MLPNISEEKIKWIKKLRELGNTYDNIRKITKSSKRTVKKVCEYDLSVKKYKNIYIFYISPHNNTRKYERN